MLIDLLGINVHYLVYTTVLLTVAKSFSPADSDMDFEVCFCSVRVGQISGYARGLGKLENMREEGPLLCTFLYSE
jgi:hypothetical protein